MFLLSQQRHRFLLSILSAWQFSRLKHLQIPKILSKLTLLPESLPQAKRLNWIQSHPDEFIEDSNSKFGMRLGHCRKSIPLY